MLVLRTPQSFLSLRFVRIASGSPRILRSSKPPVQHRTVRNVQPSVVDRCRHPAHRLTRMANPKLVAENGSFSSSKRSKPLSTGPRWAVPDRTVTFFLIIDASPHTFLFERPQNDEKLPFSANLRAAACLLPFHGLQRLGRTAHAARNFAIMAQGSVGFGGAHANRISSLLSRSRTDRLIFACRPPALRPRAQTRHFR